MQLVKFNQLSHIKSWNGSHTTRKIISLVAAVSLSAAFFYYPVFAQGTENINITIPSYAYGAYTYWQKFITDDNTSAGNNYYSGQYNLDYDSNTVQFATTSLTAADLALLQAILKSNGCVYTSGSSVSQTYTCKSLKTSYDPTISERVFLYKNYIFPNLKGVTSQVNNKYNAYDSVFVDSSGYIMAFYSKTYISSTAMDVYYSNGTNAKGQYHRMSNDYGAYGLYWFFIPYVTGLATCNFPGMNGNTMDIIPLYNGTLNGCPTEIRELLNIDSKEVEAIKNLSDVFVNGNSSSQSIVNDASNKRSTLNSNINSIHNTDVIADNNFNSALNSIDTNINFNSNTKFINAMTWISQQFTLLVIDTPFEFLITFSLVLGIALTLLGKLRNR